MRWQNLLTKTEMRHLREFLHTPTLESFKHLRVLQNRMQRNHNKIGLYAPICAQCDRIEAKLKKGGKL